MPSQKTKQFTFGLVTTPKTVVYTWLQVTPTTLTTVVRTARSTNEPSGINDLDNAATEFKYPGLPASQLELTKPLEAKHLQLSTAKFSCH